MKSLFKFFIGLALLIAIASVPGCGLFKKVSSNSEKDKLRLETESSKKTDSTVIKTDKSVIVEKSSADTIINVPGVTINTTKATSLAELAKGLTTIDSGLFIVKVTLDSANMTIKTEVTKKPENIPVKVDKEKTTYLNTTEQAKTSTEEQSKAVLDTKKKTGGKVSEPKNTFWLWAAIVGVAALIIGAVFLLVKRYLPKYPVKS